MVYEEIVTLFNVIEINSVFEVNDIYSKLY